MDRAYDERQCWVNCRQLPGQNLACTKDQPVHTLQCLAADLSSSTKCCSSGHIVAPSFIAAETVNMPNWSSFGLRIGFTIPWHATCIAQKQIESKCRNIGPVSACFIGGASPSERLPAKAPVNTTTSTAAVNRSRRLIAASSLLSCTPIAFS